MRTLTTSLAVLIAPLLPSSVHAETSRPLTAADRMHAAESVLEVYQAHQEGRSHADRSALPIDAVRRKARRAVALSLALERMFGTAISRRDLEREAERIAVRSLMPGRLRELQSALADDGFLFQEVLARETLAERWAHAAFDTRPELVARYGGSFSRFVDDMIEEFGDSELESIADPNASLPKPGIDDSNAACSGDDRWAPSALFASMRPRTAFTTVWTGREMIIFGGGDNEVVLKSGAAYDPRLDSWRQISRIGAPLARSSASAVWTGESMLVWGGYGTLFDEQGTVFNADGGRYIPSEDRWESIPTAGAPSPRLNPSVVWAGDRLVVWGGQDRQQNALGDGASWRLGDSAWTPLQTIGAPSPRSNAAAVWTGRELLVWGGQQQPQYPSNAKLSDGFRYDPATDLWSPISSVGSPSALESATAVWTGHEMLIWGGTPNASVIPRGGRYNPTTDSWRPITAQGQPLWTELTGHAVHWTGSQLLVWGSSPYADSSGGLYDPRTDHWTPMIAPPSPQLRTDFSSVFADDQLVVYEHGFTNIYAARGQRYEPASDRWTPVATTQGPASAEHTAVWTGNSMIVFSGKDDLNTVNNVPGRGDRFDPALDAWSVISTVGAPLARRQHSAVWTGQQMIVWGGISALGYSNDGGRYDPITDSWQPTSLIAAPSPRTDQSAVWSGSEMIVWGGGLTTDEYKDGARYNPLSDSWTAVSLFNAPGKRRLHTAVWSGTRMLVWGGQRTAPNGQDIEFPSAGGSYDPVTNLWSAIPVTNQPTPRIAHSAVWTGSEMIIFGGFSSNQVVGDGRRYNPTSSSWASLPTSGAQSTALHSATWTGSQMVQFGGQVDTISFGTVWNGRQRYDRASNRWTYSGLLPNAPSARRSPTAVYADGMVLIWGGEDVDHPQGFFRTAMHGGAYVLGAADADRDGVADSCDCAPNDPGAQSIPTEASGLNILDGGTRLVWNRQDAAAGLGTQYDLLRGTGVSEPVGSGSEQCLASNSAQSFLIDSVNPGSGTAFRYLVRSHNSCGGAGYGRRSDGTPRNSLTCP